jgi:hypothetical protein
MFKGGHVGAAVMVEAPNAEASIIEQRILCMYVCMCMLI